MWDRAPLLSGLMQPRHSYLNRFAELASCPEGSIAQSSNFGLGYVPKLLIQAPLRSGEGKGCPKQCDLIRLHAHENHLHAAEWTSM
jgi:hypothetical protein